MAEQYRQPDGSYRYCCEHCHQVITGLNKQAFMNKWLAHFELEQDAFTKMMEFLGEEYIKDFGEKGV